MLVMISMRRIDEDVEILGGSRSSVRREGVCSYDQEADAVGAQRIDKLAPFGEASS